MLRILLLVAVLALVTTACSRATVQNAPTAIPTASGISTSAAATATAGQATAVVNVVLKESSVAPDRSTVQSGEITFRVQNTGTVKHQFLIVKTDLPPGSLPMVADGSKVDETKLDKVMTIGAIDAGKSDDAKVRLAPGKYVILSNDPTQYKAGMVASFTVTQ